MFFPCVFLIIKASKKGKEIKIFNTKLDSFSFNNKFDWFLMILFLYKERLNNDKMEIKAIAKMLMSFENLFAFCCSLVSLFSAFISLSFSDSLNWLKTESIHQQNQNLKTFSKNFKNWLTTARKTLQRRLKN